MLSGCPLIPQYLLHTRLHLGSRHRRPMRRPISATRWTELRSHHRRAQIQRVVRARLACQTEHHHTSRTCLTVGLTLQTLYPGVPWPGQHHYVSQPSGSASSHTQRAPLDLIPSQRVSGVSAGSASPSPSPSDSLSLISLHLLEESHPLKGPVPLARPGEKRKQACPTGTTKEELKKWAIARGIGPLS